MAVSHRLFYLWGSCLSRTTGIMKKYVLTPIMAVLCLGLTACEEREDPHYPPQPYPQQYPQPANYPQPYPAPAPAPYPAPGSYPAPAGTQQQPQPTAIPGVMKMPDGQCSITPPQLDPNTPAQPMVGPCPPGI